MTKKELIAKLLPVPDEAEIFINADHGQQDSKSYIVEISSTPRRYWDDDDDLDVVSALKNDDIGLVILDSATLHYRIESGHHDTERGERKSLTRQITALLRLCRKRKIAVVLTSQVYTDVDIGVFKPLGGHVLHHNAKTIIRIDKLNNGLREMILMKHRSLAEGKKALFKLTENGLECVEG